MTKLRILPVLLAALLLAALCSPMSGAGKEAAEARRAKARYYLLEAMRLDALDSLNDAYAYYMKAYDTDSTYPEAAQGYGRQRLRSQNRILFTDSAVATTLGMLRKFNEAYPEDFYESSYFAYLCSQLGDTDMAIKVMQRLIDAYPQRTALLLSQAQHYQMEGQVDSALHFFRLYERAEGRSNQTTIGKMGLHLSRNDTTAALAELDSLVAENPRDAAHLTFKGQILELLERPDSALQAFRDAEALDPASGIVKLALGEYYAQRGDSVKYDEYIYGAMMADDLILEQKLDYLSAYLQNLVSGNLDTGRGDELFGVLRKQYPHEPEVLYLAARYSAAKGDSGSAIEDIQYAIDLTEGDKGEMPSALMSYQLISEKYDDVFATYRKYYGGKPDAEVAEQPRMFYAAAATQKGDYALADSMIMISLRAVIPDYAPGDSAANYRMARGLDYATLIHASALLTLRGDNFYQAKEMQKAFSAYDDALIFNRGNTMALNNYAYFLAENGGDLNRAEKMSKTAMEADPDNETFLDTYAWILHKLGRDEEALTYQQTALEKAGKQDEDPGEELYTHLAEIQEALGMHKEAKETRSKIRQNSRKGE